MLVAIQSETTAAVKPEEETVEVVETSTLSVEERANVYVKVALRTCQHAVGRQHHHSAVHHITVPTETAEELIRQAMWAKQ